MQWYGLVAPARTSPRILRRLLAVANEAIRTPEVEERLAAQGAVADARTPEGFRDLMAAELARWGAVVRRNDLRPENWRLGRRHPGRPAR